MKKALLIIFVSAFTSIVGYAQKQPQIQDISVYAPSKVKIDGKLTEWPNPYLGDKYLSAYNSSSRISYTMANDDNNLYLTVRGLGNAVTRKALTGGFTLTISHLTTGARKKAPDNVAITFPTPMSEENAWSIMDIDNQVGNYIDDTIAYKKQIDSVVFLATKQLNSIVKEIRVVGIKEVPDSILSVYNNEGIKAAMGFIKRQPVIEIAIPLKYLKLSVDNPVKFSYNIYLGAVREAGVANGPVVVDMSIPAPIVVVGSGGGWATGNVNANQGYMFNATDFWGEYTLAKKP